MSLSREEKAHHMLKLCELAARNAVPDIDDVQDHSMALMQRSFDSFASKMKYLLPRASAQWTVGFEKALDTSHSMRVTKIDPDKKEARRGFVGTCMACGRKEKNCRYSIDLAGDLNPTNWLKDPVSVVKEYDEFTTSYTDLYSDGYMKRNASYRNLPSIDKGSYQVGETCLRKAKLRYSLQTTLLDACYSAERDIEDLFESTPDSEKKKLTTDTLHTVTEKACQEFITRQDDLELAVADERRFVPELMVDPKVWVKVDSGRLLASGNNEEMLDIMLEQRARDTMKRLEAMHEGEDKEDEGDQVEVSDGEDEYHGTKGNKSRRRPKRKRTCVVSESDEEDCEDYSEDDCEEYSVDDCEEDSEAWTSADEDDMESDWDDYYDYKACKKKKPLYKEKRKPGGEQDDGTKRMTRAATKKLKVSQEAQGGDVPSSSGDTRGRLRRIQPSRKVKPKVVVVLEEEADEEPDKAEPHKAEPDKAEPDKAEPDKAEPDKAELDKVEAEAGTGLAEQEVAAETEVEESDEEEEDGPVEEAGGADAGADARGDGGAEAGADTGAGGGVNTEVDGGADGELATQRVEVPARRRPPESVSGMVGKMRAAGSLPSRRDVLMQVMQLQLTLEREERAQESLICTNAILTLQELMQQVERLRHTY